MSFFDCMTTTMTDTVATTVATSTKEPTTIPAIHPAEQQEAVSTGSVFALSLESVSILVVISEVDSDDIVCF